jgi:hypothetical protein
MTALALNRMGSPTAYGYMFTMYSFSGMYGVWMWFCSRGIERELGPPMSVLIDPLRWGAYLPLRGIRRAGPSPNIAKFCAAAKRGARCKLRRVATACGAGRTGPRFRTIASLVSSSPKRKAQHAGLRPQFVASLLRR